MMEKEFITKKSFFWNSLPCLFWALVFTQIALSQENIVPNGDFENKTACPFNYPLSSISLVDYWEPCNGSPDYFHECNSQVSPSFNRFGMETALSDSGFIAISCYTPVLTNAHEIAKVELLESLEPNEQYYFEMYVSLADSSNYAIGELAAYFSQDEPDIQSGSTWPPYVPQIVNNPVANPLTSKIGWVVVKGVFTAQGGESWLAIGAFENDDNLSVQQVSNHPPTDYSFDLAYYYIDNVLLLPLDVWLGLEEGEKSGFSVYPNPAKNTLTVEGKQNLSEVWLTDMRGKRLRTFYSVGAKWQTDVSDLPTGIYLVRCVSENGHLSTKKVVVN